jgi:hypothetical protein
MNVCMLEDPSLCQVALTADERSALIWALEVGRALRLRDPALSVLAAEEAMSVGLLDELADRLFVAGSPTAVTH